MDGNRRGGLIIVFVTALLIVLSFFMPKGTFLRFTGKSTVERSARVEPAKHYAMRAKVTVPVPRRYIEAARQDVAVLMADPAWAGQSREVRESRLNEVLVLRAADAEYWSMPPARQRSVAQAFVRAFLDEPGGRSVDK